MRTPDVAAALAHRFGDAGAELGLEPVPGAFRSMAGRGSCRAYASRAVSPALVRTLAALALSAPTKSDLQQRDIVVISDPGVRARINDLLGETWIAAAPVFLVFCANGRRQVLLHEWRGRPFNNDHLDAFFNAAVDAGIALATFAAAAEAAGLGCCPLSAVRNHCREISALLGLPERVVPVAGMTLGWPEAEEAAISPRLPLSVTVHENRYGEEGLRDAVEAYDARRRSLQPYARQRQTEVYGEQADYGWSEDKARQYAVPQRTDFGAFVRNRGFNLD